MARFDLPLNLPDNASPSSSPADILQQEAIKSIRLELNCRKPVSHVYRSRSVTSGTRDSYTHMEFLPGGTWLLTVQRYHRMLMTRVTTRMLVWSFTDADNPRCVFGVELAGTYRSSAMALKDGDQLAILVLGVEENCNQYVSIFIGMLLLKLSLDS